MRLQVAQRAVAAPAHVTGEHFVAGVQLQVSLQDLGAGEALSALVAGVIFLPAVGQLVAFQRR